MSQGLNEAQVGYDALIDVASLRQSLAAPQLRILDCRHDLAQPDLGRMQYVQAHIPGAVFADVDRDLSGAKTGKNGRHPLPGRAELAARLRSWGVDTTSQVVAYDASEGSYAARAWWLLRWLGHSNVAVLDGGWNAWLAAGYPTSEEEPAPRMGDFVARVPLETTIEVETVAQWSQSTQAASANLLIDARAPDRYEGRNETVDPVAGHVPGAINRFWKQNLSPDGRFKSPARLRSEYIALLGDRSPCQVAFLCGSGVTSCHDILAMHVARLQGAALFPGSWSQWIADPSRPVRIGAAA
ncbi:MAG TPA: sulfurtransferase [Burkholderiaceae bacterium]|nr:sulfurtransferase [Burkholderiaceae bacterium]